MDPISSNSMSNSSIVVSIRVSFTLSIDSTNQAISSIVPHSMDPISSNSMSDSSIVVSIRVSFTLSIDSLAQAISSNASNAIANVGQASICSDTMNSISTDTIEGISIRLGFRLSSHEDNQGKTKQHVD